MGYPNTADALALATIAHSGQVYGTGPYIEHPIAVAHLILDVVGPGDLVSAALLHDVVEDTSVTLHHLRILGYPEAVVEAVDGVTRRRGETYVDFIIRASQQRGSRLIKLADNWHNMSTLPENDRRRKRYMAARTVLVSVHGCDPWEGYGKS